VVVVGDDVVVVVVAADAIVGGVAVGVEVSKRGEFDMYAAPTRVTKTIGCSLPVTGMSN
jgi:hypothetical protein